MNATDRWEHALQLQQSGDLTRAELAYQQIIASDPGNAEAWEKLGAVKEAQGKIGEALGHYQHAVSIKPDCADAYFRLGCVYGAEGRRAEAVTNYRQAVRYRPDHVEALTSLGVALGEQGQLGEALVNLRAAARLQPDSARIHYNLGVALVQQASLVKTEDAAKALSEAEQSLNEAIRLQPTYAAPHYALGNLRTAQGDNDAAIACFGEALQLKPDYGDACNNLGLALIQAGRPEEAVILLRQAVRLMPTSAEAHNNLGLALSELGRLADAETCYLESLRLNPRYADAHNNLGSAYKEQGRLEEALACYQIALWLSPDRASVHWNRSLALLQMGNFEEGWQEYEWRWQRRNMKPRSLPQPRWDGSPLEGRTLLIYMEQGLGDMIQMIRFAPLAKATGGKVVVECSDCLVSLFSTCEGIDVVVAEGTPLPAFDVHIPLMSLPPVLKTTLATLPSEVPYLFAPAEKTEHWRKKLDGSTAFKVGVVWQGNPKHPWDRHRSFPVRELAPLAEMEGVELISLQRGQGTEQLGQGPRFSIAELDGMGESFADTAANLANLELLITADTAIAHLAGALGVRVWVAIAAIADWRWLRGRDDSPWYPTMRLFRQAELGKWSPVFEKMARELAREKNRCRERIKGAHKGDIVLFPLASQKG